MTPDELAYRALQRTIAVGAALLLACGIAVLIFAASASQTRCEQTQAIRAYILEATDRAIETLPTLDYYKAHPSELAGQLQNLREQRSEFVVPLDCSLI